MHSVCCFSRETAEFIALHFMTTLAVKDKTPANSSMWQNMHRRHTHNTNKSRKTLHRWRNMSMFLGDTKKWRTCKNTIVLPPFALFSTITNLATCQQFRTLHCDFYGLMQDIISCDNSNHVKASVPLKGWSHHKYDNTVFVLSHVSANS